MKLESLITFFDGNPTAKLLRSTHAAYVVFFLHQTFKCGGDSSKLQSEMIDELARFLDFIHETAPDALVERAEEYLIKWSIGETRWLRRYFELEHSEPIYQLTSHAEDVLTFLIQIVDRNRGFVGTESRLSRIIATLSDITVRGSSDRERRLAFLRAERKRIDEELESIEAGELVATHTPTAIRERFGDIVSDLISLLGDFRAVEDSFKRITRDVQKRHFEAIDSRGTILGHVLKAEDELKEQDQGASFHAFVRLILMPDEQEKLETMIAQLDAIEEIAEQLEGKRRVQGMITSLSQEADKVLQVTRRLNSTLRRLLDSKATSKRIQLAELLREIRSLAIKHANTPPDFGLELHTEFELLNIHQRSFWEPPVQFDQLTLSTAQYPDDERALNFRELASKHNLDWDALAATITRALDGRTRVSLPQILQDCPAKGGVIEVLGYLQLAHDGGHEVDECKTETVYVDNPHDTDESRPYEIPRVVFLADRLQTVDIDSPLGQ